MHTHTHTDTHSAPSADALPIDKFVREGEQKRENQKTRASANKRSEKLANKTQ